MQVDDDCTARKKEVITKQNRRIQKPLRSPSEKRQPLKEICINLDGQKYQGKRKSNDLDVVMENAEVETHCMKRNKSETTEDSEKGGFEGERSIPNWTPGCK